MVNFENEIALIIQCEHCTIETCLKRKKKLSRQPQLKQNKQTTTAKTKTKIKNRERKKSFAGGVVACW